MGESESAGPGIPVGEALQRAAYTSKIVRALPPSYREALQAKKERLEEELQRVDRALEALDRSPEIDELLTLVGQALH